jgi:hypothetical protein
LVSSEPGGEVAWTNRLSSREVGERPAVSLRAKAVVELEGVGSVFLGEYHVKEVCHRLDAAGYRTVFELIRNRPETGARLTGPQMRVLHRVLVEWIGEGDVRALDDVVKLREELEAELEGRDETG